MRWCDHCCISGMPRVLLCHCIRALQAMESSSHRQQALSSALSLRLHTHNGSVAMVRLYLGSAYHQWRHVSRETFLHRVAEKTQRMQEAFIQVCLCACVCVCVCEMTDFHSIRACGVRACFYVRACACVYLFVICSCESADGFRRRACSSEVAATGQARKRSIQHGAQATSEGEAPVARG